MPSSSWNDPQRTAVILFVTAACLCTVLATWGDTSPQSADRAEQIRSAAPANPPPANLLVNPGFEEHTGIGSIPTGWHAVDRSFEYDRWIAPRVERTIGELRPRSGRYMVGLATDMLGVDTNDEEFHIPRAALYQTITVPGRTRGTFSLYYNDLGSTALSHISAIRLAYTINPVSLIKEGTIGARDTSPSANADPSGVANTSPPAKWDPSGAADMSTIEFPATFSPEPDPAGAKPGVWSEPFFRVSQQLPRCPTALGDWTLAAIPVVTDAPDATIELALWIGIFDHQGSTELGYYRIDDAAFVIHFSD